MKSFPLPLPSRWCRISGKEVEVHDSGSRQHQLCGFCDLQLIQSHVAPSHGPPATVLSPLFFPAKSLLLPKPRGNKEHPKTTWPSLFTLPNCTILSLLPQNLVVLLLLQNCVVLLSLWLPFLGFKSQHLPSSAAPFPTPPTISYTCQHSLFFQLYWAA